MTVEASVPLTRLHPSTFRSALRRHASAVAVITGRPAGELRRPVGFTATSLTSASLTPPLISFYVGTDSDSWRSLRHVRYFAVNLLGTHQRALAERFASKGVDRFATVEWSVGPLGVPVLENASLRLVCQRQSAFSVGDHTLVVGLALMCDPPDTWDLTPPLVYHNAQFGRWEPLAG